MKVLPTMDGGLRLEAQGEDDWQILNAIALDGESDLASRLSSLMDEEAMWDDIVQPELETSFSSQREHVLKVVRAARALAEDDQGELHIPPEDANTWYAALNQARLAIEEKYHFATCEDLDPTALNDAPRLALLRDRFYLSLQSVLMEYVMKE